MKLSEIGQQLISLATAANQARTAENRRDDSPIVTSGTRPPAIAPRMTAEERRLHDFLAAQSPSSIYMLTAIMYLGRGDFDVKDLRDQYKDVSETFGGPQWAARQM